MNTTIILNFCDLVSSNLKIRCLSFQDMWLYVSEQEKFDDFGSEGALVWQETNIPYAVWTAESSRTLSLKYYPSEVLVVPLVNLISFQN